MTLQSISHNNKKNINKKNKHHGLNHNHIIKPLIIQLQQACSEALDCFEEEWPECTECLW